MRLLFSLLFVGIALTACRVSPPIFSDPASGTLVVTAIGSDPTATEGKSVAPPSPTATSESAATPVAFPTAVVPDATPSPELSTSLPLSMEQARATTAAELTDTMPPLRDEISLSTAYQRIAAVAATPPPIVDLQPGTVENFFISNVDDNTVSVIEAELMSIGENAYFWFDLGDGSVNPDKTELATVAKAFDDVFDALFPYFGTPADKGVRVHIVHASPLVLCAVPDQCGLAGYFSSRDELPGFVDPQSNERKMFVMNAQQFGRFTYIDTLSHELRHLLGNRYDLGDEDWFIEGAAMLAEDLMGFTTLPQYRAIQFLSDPDQQLNSWQQGNTGPRYGQGYLVNRFLYDRLGADLYREFTMSPWPGLLAVNDIGVAHGVDVTGESLWLDWLVSMALLDLPDVPERYRWDGPGLEPVAMTSIDATESIEATVHQYAADYYVLPPGTGTIELTAAPGISLLGTPAPSGDYFWYAQRANTSNPRLTRYVDLRETTEATLHYQVYVDTEEGYDFAYVSASTDGGLTWQGLVADGMRGLNPADDPSDSALTDRFYTGREKRWIEETIDLSSYSGQEILLRFEYVTDLILTYGGFAIDDIAIPKIDFFDDAESLDLGWIAEGFSRATSDLPQTWRVQLVTFDEQGYPSVEQLDVPAGGQLSHVYKALPGARRPILIVAAVAPETLQLAQYELAVSFK